MDMYVKSQIDHVISLYLGKCLMILVPSQSLRRRTYNAAVSRFS